MSEGPALPLSPAVREVIRLLEAEQQRALKIMLAPPGKTDRAKSFNASRQAQRLSQYRDALGKLKGRVTQVTGKEVRTAYRRGLRATEKMARDAGVRQDPVVGSFGALDLRRVEVISRQAAGDLHKGIDGMYRATERTVRQVRALGLDDRQLNAIIAGGFVAGAPALAQRQIREAIDRAAGKTGGLIEVPTRTGGVISFAPRHYARMVYETKLREASVVATAQRLQEQGIDLVKIIGSDSDNFCTAYVGKVFSLSGTNPDYPPLSKLSGPPFHPFCSKTIVAFIAGLQSAAAREAGKPDPLSSSLAGKSPAEAQRVYAARRREESAPASDLGDESGASSDDASGASSDDASGASSGHQAARRPENVSPAERVSISLSSPVPDAARVVRAIAGVHDVPRSMPPVELRSYRPTNSAEQGAYSVGTIRVATSAASPQLTTVHEFGHHLQRHVIGDSETAPALAGFRQAVKQTRLHRYFSSFDTAQSEDVRRWLSYTLSWDELFARAYAQWIATRSGEPNLVDAIRRTRATSQWTDADFDEVGEELDQLFREKGLTR